MHVNNALHYNQSVLVIHYNTHLISYITYTRRYCDPPYLLVGSFICWLDWFVRSKNGVECLKNSWDRGSNGSPKGNGIC